MKRFGGLKMAIMKMPPSHVHNLPHGAPISRAFSRRHPNHSRSCLRSRHFTSSALRTKQHGQQQHRKASFSARLRTALASTPVKWYPIPAALGIASLGVLQFYRVQKREYHARETANEDIAHAEEENLDPKRPQRRKRIRPSGPWYASQPIILVRAAHT